MLSLQRSCHACITSKRKCDRSIPICARCSKQSLVCQYTNSPGQDDSTRKPRTDSSTLKGSACLNIAFNPEVIRVYDSSTLLRMKAILLSFTEEFKMEKATAFIHLGSYDGVLVSPLEETWDLISSSRRRPLQRKITDLIKQGNTQTSYLSLLAYIQSALILSIPLLLDISSPPPISTTALWALTHRLWEEAPEWLEGLSRWKAWWFSESARRAILVCNVLLRTRMCLEQGYAKQSLCIEALPFDATEGLWEGRWEGQEEKLVSVAEFVTMKGDEPPGSTFEELILLAFKDAANHIS